MRNRVNRDMPAEDGRDEEECTLWIYALGDSKQLRPRGRTCREGQGSRLQFVGAGRSGCLCTRIPHDVSVLLVTVRVQELVKLGPFISLGLPCFFGGFLGLARRLCSAFQTLGLTSPAAFGLGLRRTLQPTKTEKPKQPETEQHHGVEDRYVTIAFFDRPRLYRIGEHRQQRHPPAIMAQRYKLL